MHFKQIRYGNQLLDRQTVNCSESIPCSGCQKKGLTFRHEAGEYTEYLCGVCGPERVEQGLVTLDREQRSQIIGIERQDRETWRNICMALETAVRDIDDELSELSCLPDFAADQESRAEDIAAQIFRQPHPKLAQLLQDMEDVASHYREQLKEH